MSLKIKRYFWICVILCAVGFMAVLVIEAYIKSEITSRIREIDKNAQVEFSGSLSLKDLSYNISDFESKITPTIYPRAIQVKIDSLKYKIIGGILSHANNIIIVDSQGTIKADSLEMTKEKDTKIITLNNLRVNIPNLSEIKVSNPIIKISDKGKIQASSGILFDSNSINMAVSKERAKPAQIHFTVDNLYYTLYSDSYIDVNNLTMPKTMLDMIKSYSQIHFIKFHVINKNILGLHMAKLNTSYIDSNLRTFKMYDPKYKPAMTQALNNFFDHKQDLYGYFHTKNLLTFGTSKISRPFLILSNTKLPDNEQELNNFKMPIDPPNYRIHELEPEEQEPNADKPLKNKDKDKDEDSTMIHILSTQDKDENQ